MKNAVNWFEIPVKDLTRAKKFYSSILSSEVKDMPMPGTTLFAAFPFEQGNGIGGVLVQGEGYEPSTKGSLIYLNGGDDLAAVLERIENAGGKIVLPKTQVGAHGYIAHFIDCEGNKVALHSRN